MSSSPARRPGRLINRIAAQARQDTGDQVRLATAEAFVLPPHTRMRVQCCIQIRKGLRESATADEP